MQTVQTQIRLLKEQSDEGLHCHSIKYFKKQLRKKQKLGQNTME